MHQGVNRGSISIVWRLGNTRAFSVWVEVCDAVQTGQVAPPQEARPDRSGPYPYIHKEFALNQRLETETPCGNRNVSFHEFRFPS